MTDFDDWIGSEDARVWLTRWRFLPDGTWEILEQYKMHASSHISCLSEGFSKPIPKSDVINAFKELLKTGKPITMPMKQQNFYDLLRMAWGAFRGATIYEFVTISKEVDRQNLELLLTANDFFGNWC